MPPSSVKLETVNMNSVSTAFVDEFDVSAALYYSDGVTASQCLQGSNLSVPCLGICVRDGQLCNQTCPRFLKYTGEKYTSFQGDQYFVQDAYGVINSDTTGMVPAIQSCSYSMLCPGSQGVATCSEIQINRAGWYMLKFWFPPCQQDPLHPWLSIPSPCKSPFVSSSLFYVSPNEFVGVGSIAFMTFPKQCTILQPIKPGPVIQVVDSFGNLVDGSLVSVALLACAQSTTEANCSILWPRWSPALGTFAASSNLVYHSSEDDSAIGGTLNVLSHDGLLTFTDLTVSVALKQAVLLFTDVHGFQKASPPFIVYPGSFSSLSIRQQPYIWEAGRFMLFEVVLLDSNFFVVESANLTVYMEFVVNSARINVPIQCPISGQSCSKSMAVVGIATFNFSITTAQASYTLRFFTNSSSNALSQKPSSVESNFTTVSVTSESFTVLFSQPNKLVVSGPPATVQSQQPFSVSVQISDTFGNLFTNFLFSLPNFSFLPGCDSILIQMVCDVQICEAQKITASFSTGACCLVPKTTFMNNEFGCIATTNATPATYEHIFSIQIGGYNITAPQVIDSSSAGIELSSLAISTSATLGGNLRKYAVLKTTFENLTIGPVGRYSLRVFVQNLTINTPDFSVGE